MADKSTTVVVDLTGYKDKMGQRVPEGRYKVVVEDTETDQSNAGNPMINVWLRVVGGEYADAVIVDRLVMTEKSLFRVVGFMQAIGLPTPRKRLQVNHATWRGKALYIDVEDGEPYNKKIRSEVRGYERVRQAPAAAAAVADADTAGLNELAGLSGLDEFRPKEGDDLRNGIQEAAAVAVAEEDPAEAQLRALEGLDEVDLSNLDL